MHCLSVDEILLCSVNSLSETNMEENISMKLRSSNKLPYSEIITTRAEMPNPELTSLHLN